MKTPQQAKFEDLIIRIIQSSALILDRKGLLEDFKEDSSVCYEIFCAKIYELFSEREHGNLVVDESGRTHIYDCEKKSHHIYFTLLTEKDYLDDSEDVIDYINLALSRLEEQVDIVCRSIN